jgi:hypothetical protein
MNPGGIGMLWNGELSGKVTSGVPVLMSDAFTLPYPIALQGGSQVGVHIDDRNASPTCNFQAIILRLSG